MPVSARTLSTSRDEFDFTAKETSPGETLEEYLGARAQLGGAEAKHWRIGLQLLGSNRG